MSLSGGDDDGFDWHKTANSSIFVSSSGHSSLSNSPVLLFTICFERKRTDIKSHCLFESTDAGFVPFVTGREYIPVVLTRENFLRSNTSDLLRGFFFDRFGIKLALTERLFELTIVGPQELLSFDANDEGVLVSASGGQFISSEFEFTLDAFILVLFKSWYNELVAALRCGFFLTLFKLSYKLLQSFRLCGLVFSTIGWYTAAQGETAYGEGSKWLTVVIGIKERLLVRPRSYVGFPMTEKKKMKKSCYLWFDFSWNFQVGWVRDSKNTVTKNDVLSKHFCPCL